VAQADYIYLNGRPVAVLNGSTLYYLHDDMLGTPQLATDSGQNMQWQASYDAFGQASVSGTVTQNLRLPGQYFDVESGWNHNGFRDYAPQLGRYIEPDPLGMQGNASYYHPRTGRFLSGDPTEYAGATNLYAYVDDNPISSDDPLGLQTSSGNFRGDPNSQACQRLAQRIDNLAKEIQKRDNELFVDKCQLPEFGQPGAPLSASRQGHRDLMSNQINTLGQRLDEYMNKCGGGPPPALSADYGEVPNSRGVGPNPLPTISPSVQQTTIWTVVGGIVMAFINGVEQIGPVPLP
jgi:RHS repeat-associated protein